MGQQAFSGTIRPGSAFYYKWLCRAAAIWFAVAPVQETATCQGMTSMQVAETAAQAGSQLKLLCANAWNGVSWI